MEKYWRDSEFYKPIAVLDASGLAWEALRRNPEYAAAARAWLFENQPPVAKDTASGVHVVKGCSEANRWGLEFFEDPSLPASQARLFWCVDADPSVLSVVAEPAGQNDPHAFDVQRFQALAIVLICPDGSERLLIGNGTHRVQLAITVGTLLKGPVSLWCPVGRTRGGEDKAKALMRFLHICRRQTFPRSLFGVERRAPRIAAILRVFDAKKAGATQREIAAALFGQRWVEEAWDEHYLRMRVQRLLRAGACLITDGYRKLLK